MCDGEKETIHRSLGILPQAREGWGQDRREDAHECPFCGAAVGLGEDGRGSKRSETKSKPVIYVLRNTDWKIFYVGITTNPKARLSSYRGTYGPYIELEIIQTEFQEEMPLAAEQRWIRHYQRIGMKLENKQSRIEPLIDDEEWEAIEDHAGSKKSDRKRAIAQHAAAVKVIRQRSWRTR